MKVTVNTKEKQFEPIELNITIETLAELETLYEQLAKSSGSYALFDILDQLKEQYS